MLVCGVMTLLIWIVQQLPGIGAGMRTFSAMGRRVVNDDDRTGFPLCVHSANQYFSISPDVTRQDILRFFGGLKLTGRDVKWVMEML